MSKAEKLSILKENSFNVPEFVYVTSPDYKLPFKANSYIVRSSFSLEDSKKSFAGLFKSYGPIKKSEIDTYLKKVLDGSKEAKIYLKKSKISKRIKAGAIIQKYVFSNKGGVCFTNYNANIIIEANKNAALVTSGVGKNKTYNISRFSLDVDNKPNFINALVADALDIEAIFKKPQDIEWSYSKNKIYILQTRDAKSSTSKKWSNVIEFLSIIPPSAWDRYLAFSYFNSSEFRRISYQLADSILNLEVIDWKKIMKKSYRKPKSKSPINAFKEAVINYGYYGLLNQITEDNSLAMERVGISAKRLKISEEQLLDYSIWKKKSIYSKIIDNPEKYEETFMEDINSKNTKPKSVEKKVAQYNFSKREKRLADFFAMLYDIKGNGVVYHDYHISPILKETYNNLPENAKRDIKDYIKILELQGFKLPELDRKVQIGRPSYELPGSINGIVGKNILVYKDVPPEVVLKLKDVKCIISEEGGILSHAAILAKEFDIPFIAGIRDSTKLLIDGDELKIGSNGEYVYIKNISKKTEIKVGTK